jgi:hypothetical protein
MNRFDRAAAAITVLGCGALMSLAAVAKAEPSPNMPLPLKVEGTRILNSKDEPVLLRGVNVPSLEWTNDPEGSILKSINAAIRDWHANIIRLPLSQDRWFGKTPEQGDGGAAYRALVAGVVDTCATQGCYIILDLHWSDCGEWGKNIGQHSLPDTNSVTFWTDCATKFKNHPAVLFDLYNEPRDVSWDAWLNGGPVVERGNAWRKMPEKHYDGIGLQTLLNVVRATGAKNVVVAGPLDWAYDFSGVLAGIQLFDTEGNGVIYANHVYNNKGDTAPVWIAKMEKAAAVLPVIVTEFGGSGGPHRRMGRGGRWATNTNDDWLLHVMQALQDHHWAWTAWCFHPYAGPPMLSDWNFTPTPDFGIFVKEALAGTLPRYTPPEKIESLEPAPQPASPATNAPAPAAAPK